jgi:hypothetical protein
VNNPLNEEMEKLSSRMIGDMEYKGKKVVLLEDALDALEELEARLWGICQQEVRKALAREAGRGYIEDPQ